MTSLKNGWTCRSRHNRQLGSLGLGISFYTIFIYVLTLGNKMSSIWHWAHVIYCLVSLNLYKPSMLTPTDTLWLWFSLVKWVCCKTGLWAPAWYRRPPMSVSCGGVLSNSSPMRWPGLSPRSVAISCLGEQGFARYRTKPAKFWHYPQPSSLNSSCILPCIMPQVVMNLGPVTWLDCGEGQTGAQACHLRRELILTKEAAQWWPRSA